MSRDAKIVVGVVVGLLAVICLCASVFFIAMPAVVGTRLARNVETSSANVPELASRIAGFDLPSRYQPDFGLDTAGFIIAAYTAGDSRSHLMLFQAPDWVHVDQAELERQMRQSLGGRYGDLGGTTVVDRRDVTIRGEPATLVIAEGVNNAGETYRTATALFAGRGGPALVTIAEPASRWDDEAVDAFIQSIR